jgi:hypothetical protein
MAKTNLQAFMMLVFGILAILLVIVGVGFGISAWIQANYGASAVLMVWGGFILISGIFAGWGMSLRTQRATLENLVDFQSADDRGEVARAKVLQEVVRSTWQGEKQRYNEQPSLPAPQQQRYALPVDWSQAALPAEAEWAVIE